MRSEQVQVGTKVRVRKDYRVPELRGMVGTVVKIYGRGKRTAVHMSSEDGLWQLVSPEDLEELENTTLTSTSQE